MLPMRIVSRTIDLADDDLCDAVIMSPLAAASRACGFER